MTNEDVYNVTRRIPKGKVSTYGEIARLCGCPGGARAVGNVGLYRVIGLSIVRESWLSILPLGACKDKPGA